MFFSQFLTRNPSFTQMTTDMLSSFRQNAQFLERHFVLIL